MVNVNSAGMVMAKFVGIMLDPRWKIVCVHQLIAQYTGNAKAGHSVQERFNTL